MCQTMSTAITCLFSPIASKYYKNTHFTDEETEAPKSN